MQFVATFLLLALQNLDKHRSVPGKLDTVMELLNTDEPSEESPPSGSLGEHPREASYMGVLKPCPDPWVSVYVCSWTPGLELDGICV